ncbi:MAG: phosphatase PAP2 family protein, partial [Bacteroidota bacterium]|nr:phosphatase PAP2 family protein [Bacteroidota bacterium]
MLETIQNIDTNIFLALNGLHSPFFDTLMFWISHKLTWIPLYLFLVYLIIKNYKLKSYIFLIAIGLLILLSDQLSVHLFKEVFQRFRPCRPESPIHELVHIVNNHCGGKYGFISSHATNTFALAIFLSAILKKFYRYFPITIIIWATIVAYSRIYLGVHYFGDVLGGAIFGSLLGLLIAKLSLVFFE